MSLALFGVGTGCLGAGFLLGSLLSEEPATVVAFDLPTRKGTSSQSVPTSSEGVRVAASSESPRSAAMADPAEVADLRYRVHALEEEVARVKQEWEAIYLELKETEAKYQILLQTQIRGLMDEFLRSPAAQKLSSEEQEIILGIIQAAETVPFDWQIPTLLEIHHRFSPRASELQKKLSTIAAKTDSRPYWEDREYKEIRAQLEQIQGEWLAELLKVVPNEGQAKRITEDY